MLTIEKAQISDIPLIRQLTMQVWPQTYTPILGNEQVSYMLGKFYAPESLAEQIRDAGHQFIICYSDEEPVGFASYGLIAEKVFKLHKLYVLRGLQGKGIGKFMISYVVSEITKAEATALMLNVNIHNQSAIAFYQKNGFSKYKEEDIDIGSGYYMNDYVFRLAVE